MPNIYDSISPLQQDVNSATDIKENIIDNLIFTAVFSEKDDVKTEARKTIREKALQLGAIPASIKNFYFAIGSGRIKPNFTVPAINIRFMTYDTARIIFQLMNKNSIGPVVFEIARSEIEYTFQRPDEYAISILAAAIKEGYKGPVYIQGDHFQFSAKRYKEDPETEKGKIKTLIKEAIDAEFLNIDIDASTLVDLSKATQDEQQTENYNVTAEMTKFIRSLQNSGQDISIGAEIGHIGGKNSTPEELTAFMEGYKNLIPDPNQGISKISVQTGTSHGGIPLPSGKIADVKLDFSVIDKTGEVARAKYHIGGVVQHGASTLPNELFNEFPKNNTLEIHLATGFQNITYDNLPKTLKDEMYSWLDQNHQAEWDDTLSHEQNIYKTRKRAIGPFKKQTWSLSDADKASIREGLEKQLTFLFEKLNVFNTKDLIAG